MLIYNVYNILRKYRLLLCFLILSQMMSVSTSAQEIPDQTVRVGSFEENYNTVNEKGERSGYGYEYLQNIAGYAGWSYEYVPGTWKDCFKQLENDEVDLLGGISYTEERAEKMLFSDMPMGEEEYYIYADAPNIELTAAELGSFEGKKIGVLKDHTPEDVLDKWEVRYEIAHATYQYFQCRGDSGEADQP